MLNSLLLHGEMKGRNISRSFWGSCRVRYIFLLCIAAATLAAQDQDTDSDSGNTTRRISAASQFFDHDFVNFYVYGNGVWDTRVPVFNSLGDVTYGSGLGWEAGGGVTGTHTFKDGGITINYRGAYRDYQTAGSTSGQQQSLSLAYSKRLNRHWTFGATASAAILGYGTSYFSESSLASTTPGNSISTNSRFADLGLSLTYNQTRRLGYVFSGSFLYNSYPEAVSTRGVSGSASALYRLTAKTTIGASYSRTYFSYSRHEGTSSIDAGSLTLSHRFPDHWQIDLSAGVNHSHSVGTAEIPVSFVFQGETLVGYYLGPYSRTLYSPAFQGVLSHSFRRSSLSVSGGQSIMAGNGLYLASKDQFANGSFSYSTRHSNFSLGANYTRLNSVANTVTQAYSYYGASAAYGINLVRYVSANFRYDLIHYDEAFSLISSITEQRVPFGLSLSTKSVPLTLF